MRVELLNEQHLRVQLASDVDPAAIEQLLRALLGARCYDIVIAYQCLVLHINVAHASIFEVQEQVQTALQHIALSTQAQAETKANGIRLDIPVCYDRRLGIDLLDAAEQARLGVDEFVRRHHESTYAVQAMGFSPGFAYLGTLDERLRLPRLDTPRTSVPAGSVAIAEDQTAVYPLASPGGWRIIGRSPKLLLDLNKDPISPFEIGMSVRFYPISFAEYEECLKEDAAV